MANDRVLTVVEDLERTLVDFIRKHHRNDRASRPGRVLHRRPLRFRLRPVRGGAGRLT